VTEALQAQFLRCREEGGRQRCDAELRPWWRRSGWEAALREAASWLGSLTAQNQISPRLGFHIGRVTPLIPGTFLVSAELCQSIPIMRFMVSADLIQPIPKIFCIG
jgi:hypothetical protein